MNSTIELSQREKEEECREKFVELTEMGLIMRQGKEVMAKMKE